MSDKYIIRNCPAIYGVFFDKCKKDHYEDGTVLCQDCTDCVMKQIVKQAGYCLCPEILELLDIQEVE